ncbi:recombination protein RecT [Nocardia farcinica]|uniref:Putative phage recombinase n=1 Tax=Nocardia farcinica (strain IFM 10152) TaxID=247156 RepID=Q5YSE8_NOCFA|nr:recombination protein RecT [Nocardia farcinica]BAD58893.1 putative phage recombinase [Nocardia farcinica IFM 10152]
MARNLVDRIEQNAPAKNDDLKAAIQKMEKAFALAMPKGAEATQLIRDAFTAIQRTPKLAQCEQLSVLGAFMTCAQLGLRPGVLGQAYVLPFWDRKDRMYKAQFVAGYRGLVDLAYRSDRVLSVSARIVHANDYFELEYNAVEDRLVHRPYLDGARGEARLYYAAGRTRGGGSAITDPVTVADMLKYRDRYATAKNKEGKVFGPWVDEFDGMAKKTMIRQLSKMLPMSTELTLAVENDGSVRFDLGKDAIESPQRLEPDVIDAEAVATSDVQDAPADYYEDVPPAAEGGMFAPEGE